MHCVRNVTKDLTWVGADDRRLAMFEGVYGVRDGVSYNSYLLLDDKTVLFDTVDRRRQSRLLRAVDAIHRRLGPDALRVASQQSHASVMNHEHRSPNYTTSLADIIEVK